MGFKLQEIKRILKEHDVRDPRGCLRAIEEVAFRKSMVKPITPEPLLTLTITDLGQSGVLKIKSKKTVESKHIHLAIDGLHELADRKAAEGGGCKGCAEVSQPLSELFAKFEAELQAKREGK
jgi:hypothetical protein